MRVLWDMDGVMIPGRGTAYLARGYEGNPRNFMQKFVAACGREGTPLQYIKRADLIRGFLSWEQSHGNHIQGMGELAECLADLRHKLKVFPGAEQTIYTTNAMLEGLSMRRIEKIAEKLPYNEGLRDVAALLRKYGGTQMIFSNSNAALVDAVARMFEFYRGWGASPEVVMPDGSMKDYSPGFFGKNGVKLSGRIKPWDKREAMLEYLNDCDCSDIVAIDDTETELLSELRARGAKVFGFYNAKDADMKIEDAKEMGRRGIPVLTSLYEFRGAVLKQVK